MSIFNDAPQPWELLKYHYRRLFNLSARDMEDEPVDQMSLNIAIYSMIDKKKSKEAQMQARAGK